MDGSSGYCIIFMDAYSGYNHIKMNLIDVSKIVFMSNHDNYYYDGITLQPQ